MNRIQEILNDLWAIYTLQKMTGTVVLEDVDSFVTCKIAEHYNISNENSQLFYVLEDAFTNNPLKPITIRELLDICEDKGLIEGEDNE